MKKTPKMQNVLIPVSDLHNGVYYIYTKTNNGLHINSKLVINK